MRRLILLAAAVLSFGNLACAQESSFEPLNQEALTRALQSRDEKAAALASVRERLASHPEETPELIAILAEALTNPKTAPFEFSQTVVVAQEHAVAPCISLLASDEKFGLAVATLQELFPIGRPELEQALSSPDSSVRQRVLMVYLNLRDEQGGGQSQEALTSLLSDEVLAVRVEAGSALVRLCGEESEAWNQLEEDFSLLDDDARFALINSLTRSEINDREGLRRLLEKGLTDSQVLVRGLAAIKFQAFELGNEARVIAVLRETIRSDVFDHVRTDACRALGRYGATAMEAMEDLKAVAGSPETSLSSAACLAICQISEVEGLTYLPSLEKAIEASVNYSSQRHDLLVSLRDLPLMLRRLLPSLDRAMSRPNDRLAVVIAVSVLHATPNPLDSAPPPEELFKAHAVLRGYFAGHRTCYVSDKDLDWLVRNHSDVVLPMVVDAIGSDQKTESSPILDAVRAVEQLGPAANGALPDLKARREEALEPTVMEILDRAIESVQDSGR